MKQNSNNRILFYTMLAITAIATYITINSYYTQVAIYQEKELFKLDCIANAVAYNISGDEHSRLISQFPNSDLAHKVKEDSAYKMILMQISMAKMMTKIPSEISTVIKDSVSGKFKQAISTDDHDWLIELSHGAQALDTMFGKGGMIGLYKSSDGYRLGALSPVFNEEGKAVGVLQVEETFDSFINQAKKQIYFNILISLAFIMLIGILMFFSVKSILEQMRRELVANVSHDLRTPLASIHGYIETLLMKKDSLDEETREKYLNTTLQSTQKLKTLVDELFELSKIESRERKLNVETFSVKELAFDVVNNFKHEAQEKGIEIAVDSSEQISAVKADLALIDRTFQNLIGNAIKYCTEGDKINVGIREANGKVVISISDTGSGISEEDLPHLFNRFFKGKSSKPGTGLGLAIVKGILDMHDSEYKVESKLGEGTRFTFTLNI
jgi:signal transduction histidine kinase